MKDPNWFIKLMKSAPKKKKRKNHKSAWTVDESKCLSIEEVNKLRDFCNKIRIEGLKSRRFSLVRNWFMIELGLKTGLRVGEMAFLKHVNLFLEGPKSSIVVLGKGKKKRSVWINSSFKQTCLDYIEYKKSFGYSIQEDSPLLNNLQGSKISKRALQKFFKEIIVKNFCKALTEIL